MYNAPAAEELRLNPGTSSVTGYLTENSPPTAIGSSPYHAPYPVLYLLFLAKRLTKSKITASIVSGFVTKPRSLTKKINWGDDRMASVPDSRLKQLSR